MAINIIKGDSSEIYVFESSDVGTFDASWVARFVVSATLGSTALLSGSLPKNLASADAEANTQFVLQLTPAQTSVLTEGKYVLTVEVKQLGGSPLGGSPEIVLFRREVMQENLTIKKQGIA